MRKQGGHCEGSRLGGTTCLHAIAPACAQPRLSGRWRVLLAMTLLSDFANGHMLPVITRRPSFGNTNAKKFLTKPIFMYLMIGSIIPS